MQLWVAADALDEVERRVAVRPGVVVAAACEVDEHARREAVDVAHLRDLAGALGGGALVDAERVDPEGARAARRTGAQVREGGVQVARDGEDGAGEVDGLSVRRVAQTYERASKGGGLVRVARLKVQWMSSSVDGGEAVLCGWRWSRRICRFVSSSGA